jgi:hypothetical protein
MANPSKVLAFLDLAGAWDPSLGLVMVGAIAVAIGPMTWARRQSRSLLGSRCSSRQTRTGPTPDRRQPVVWHRLGHCRDLSWSGRGYPADRSLASHPVHAGHVGWHVVVHGPGESTQTLITFAAKINSVLFDNGYIPSQLVD